MQNLFLENKLLDANANVSKTFNNNLIIATIRYKMKPKFSDQSNNSFWLYIDNVKKRLYATTLPGKMFPRDKTVEFFNCLFYDPKKSVKLFREDYLKNENGIFNYNFGKQSKTIICKVQNLEWVIASTNLRVMRSQESS